MAHRDAEKGKEEKEQKKKTKNLPSALANVLRGVGVLCGLVLALFYGSKIVMGALYLGLCPLEPLLPVLLLLGGSLPLFLPALFACRGRPDQRQPWKCCTRMGAAVGVLLLLAFFCWTVTNVVYVFRTKVVVEERFCNTTDGFIGAYSEGATTTNTTSTSTTTTTSTTTISTTALSSPSASGSMEMRGTGCVTCHSKLWDFSFTMALLDALALAAFVISLLIAGCISCGAYLCAILLCKDS